MKFRFLCSGESHGKSLNAIIEGLPANCPVNEDEINEALTKRQSGYGRGERMQIESDTVEIKSGIRFGLTTGAPVCLEIKNKDYENWAAAMDVRTPDLSDSKLAEIIASKKITKVRPGHADLAGALKYNQTDIRNILERSSARETAVKTAVGAIAKQILKNFNIEIFSNVVSIGGVETVDKNLSYGEKKGLCSSNDLRCADKAVYEKMKARIDEAKSKGVTLGGKVEVVIMNLPVGLGSFVHHDRKLDGLLAQAVMSIQAVKSVEIGLGVKSAEIDGAKMHDEIYYDGKVERSSNNAGGIEGGMSNGEPVVLTFAMKPIPTMQTPLNSIDLDDKSAHQAHFERSDTCAVPACGIVAEAMCACVLLNAFLEKFGGDSLEELTANYNSYIEMIAKRL
ncbi:MAG: chorismate synthase [Candidatus Gastranaerophilales bacterium]|nr:chorismate synthase [Candidatus Gastranaerophilales bacterium]